MSHTLTSSHVLSFRQMMFNSLFSSILFSVAVCLCLGSTPSGTNGQVDNLEVKINNKTGGFQLYLGGKLWFNSGDIYIHNNDRWYTTQNGSLKMQGMSTSSGQLDWGPMDITTFKWKDSDGINYSTYYVVFKTIPAVIFGQQWDDGGKNTPYSFRLCNTLSMWPTLRLEDEPDLGYTTWAGEVLGTQPTGKLNSLTAEIIDRIDGGFPFAVFDSKMENTLVISPQGSFMSAHRTICKPDGVDVPLWGSGLLGTVESVPKGFSYETLMVAGENVTDTMDKWGRLLRIRYKKPDTYRRSDFTINYLGYYTDRGACYNYYHGEYANYEEALIDVKKRADENGIPYRYLQLDSWWYYKGQGLAIGVRNWTAKPDVFPRGIRYLSETTQWPIVAHAEVFSFDNVYAKQNGGKYDFIIDKATASLPNDPSFWMDLLRKARDEWNMKVYEQDWLMDHFVYVMELQNEVGLGKTWLDEMGEAAKELGLTIQYSQPWTRHALQSVMIPAVTQMKVCDAYNPAGGDYNWRIGDTTRLAHALGVAAFKDTFRTLVKVEDNCGYNYSEPYPSLHTHIAVLSGGPVGPSDTAKEFNKTLIMATCMADGLILKPSRPGMSLDSSFLQRAFQSGGPDGQVYASYSEVSEYTWYQILSADLQSDYSLMPRELPTSRVYKPQISFPESVAFKYSLDGSLRGDIVHIKGNTDAIHLKKCDRSDFEYWIIAPVFPGTGGALLGELNKIVTVSEQRVLTVIKFGDTYVVKLRGAPNEMIYMSTYDMNSSKIITVNCTIASDGTGALAFSDVTKPSC